MAKKLGRPPGKTYTRFHAMLLPEQLSALAKWALEHKVKRAAALREAVERLVR